MPSANIGRRFLVALGTVLLDLVAIPVFGQRSSRCRPILAAIFGLGLVTAVSAQAQQNQAQQNEEAQTASRPLQPLPFVLLPDKPSLEPKALAILKAASDRLAAAHTMKFTAVATY